MRSRLQPTLMLAVIACILCYLLFTSSLGPQQPLPIIPSSLQDEGLPSPKSQSGRLAFPQAASSDPVVEESSDPPVEEGIESDVPKQESDTSPLRYVQAILDPSDTKFERMECPALITTRYADLKSVGVGKPRYFIALDLYNVEKLLPRLMGSIVEAVRFLGPENCALSVIEGRSDDATYDILLALQKEALALGVKFYLNRDNVDPHGEGVDRIGAFAELRNEALAPIVENPSNFSSNAIIVFINDIALCAEDILELLYQHIYQSASMTCAMDWIHDGEAFYDVWISRTINSGNLFFNIPEDADWKYKENLFFDDPPTKAKFQALQPFEVYACWGGMVTLDPAPFISGMLAFRKSKPDECYMGEPTLLGKDLWKLGMGHIATIPTVNVGRTNEETAKIKTRRGYVSNNIDPFLAPEIGQSERIEWSSKPPPMVKCESLQWDDPHWVSPV